MKTANNSWVLTKHCVKSFIKHEFGVIISFSQMKKMKLGDSKQQIYYYISYKYIIKYRHVCQIPKSVTHRLHVELYMLQ